MNLTPDEISRFWEKVDKTESCWNWTAGVTHNGYGRFKVRGKTRRAHRISLFIATGTYPTDEICVCHKCDNPRCVKPEHLFLGTTSDNLKDRDAKGRLRPVKGVKHGMARLTEEEVTRIRSLYPFSGLTQTAIAETFGISRRMVGNIVSYKNWKHLP